MDEAKRSKLWEKYSQKQDSETREALIIEYVPLVKLVSGRLSMYLGYTVEYEDLVSYGIFGLIDAIDKFDYRKGIKFETYASLRIRGAILDQIRKMDWIPRSVRQKQRQIDAAITKLESAEDKTATDEEIAKELDISLEEYYVWQGQTKVTGIASIDEFVEQGIEVRAFDNQKYADNEPEKVYEKEELKNLLKESLDKLTEKERMVVVLYYYEELTLKEISSVLEVSESRVSQLHTKALQKMKQILGSQYGILMG
ncbi:rNA polymerase sigma factor [Clostridium sp. CAG:632]|jgi:RNA polymerase sigma factor for flagellar operon FliA|nr:FliA/WhiG family RNA polymerase sigma factor [Clostridium sp.]CCY58885.1 rNA polymerase sigma factor [Clostridium sp. CAG:632]